MNRLGFYVENTTVPFCRDALRKVLPPALLIHAADRGLLREIRAGLSPDTFIDRPPLRQSSQQTAWLTAATRRPPGGRSPRRSSTTTSTWPRNAGANGRLLIDAWMSMNEPVRGPASFPDGKPDAETRQRYEAFDKFQEAFCLRLRAGRPRGGGLQLRRRQLRRGQPLPGLFPAHPDRLQVPGLPRVRLAHARCRGATLPRARCSIAEP